MLNKQKWMPRIIEGAVIVASILLAFAIDAWWQERQKVSLEKQIILAVVSEIEANTVMANEVIKSHKSVLKGLQTFLQTEPSQLTEKSPDEIFEIIVNFPFSFDFVANLSAADMLLQSPANDKNGIRIRRAVDKYTRLVREQGSISIDIERRNMLKLMSGLIAEQANFEFSSVDSIYTHYLLSNLGPDILKQMRSNPAVIKSLIEKAHIQQVLLWRLENIVENMNQLKQELQTLSHI
ncbi:hypothetical protein [Paraglaciecola aestuariivivens]